MPVGALIAGGLGAAGSIGGALIGSSASKSAAQAQLQAQQAALAQQKSMFDTGVGMVSPFVDYGKTAGSALTNLIGPGGTLSKLLTPGPDQTDVLSQLPGFKFAQDWGQKAVANLGSTTGLGGNVLKAGADYATGVAQQGFGSLVNLLQNYAGGLQNLTTTGANAAGNVLGNATTAGTAMGNTISGMGTAQASGILGSANALSGGLTGGANALTNAYLLNKVFGGAGGAGSTGIYSPATLSTLSATNPGNI